ncbi:MAG: hypothetical protein ABIH40_04455 [Candidatus Omnitrophota bacterium]
MEIKEEEEEAVPPKSKEVSVEASELHEYQKRIAGWLSRKK